MHGHAAFVKKYRCSGFTAQILHNLHTIFASVCLDFELQRVKSTAKTTTCICS